VNPATGTYEMRAEIANADGALKPGQFARVQLKGAVRSNAIAVPQVAVQDGPQGKFVYVPGKDKDGKDIAVVRPIVLGDWVEVDGVNLWIVESGLAAGDTVIVDGIAKLQPGVATALAAQVRADLALPRPARGRQGSELARGEGWCQGRAGAQVLIARHFRHAQDFH
jgi:membrane fusion protein (multidrug efflux system)